MTESADLAPLRQATRDAAPRQAPPLSTGRLANTPSLVERAADEMRRMILSGELPPGERLREERMTEILGISRPPLREAIQILHKEGLVVREPRRGAAVVSLSEDDVRQILLLRSSLERLAVEQAVPVGDPAQLDGCRAAIAEMRGSATAGNRAQLVEYGYAFHAAVVALAGMSRVNEIYESLHRQLLICMAMNLYAREHYYEDLAEHVERHQRLLELIESGDRDAVLHALAEHGEQSFTQHPRVDGQD
jgi:DNA-binding GntR family transcriptional regulator